MRWLVVLMLLGCATKLPSYDWCHVERISGEWPKYRLAYGCKGPVYDFKECEQIVPSDDWQECLESWGWNWSCDREGTWPCDG